MPSPSDATRRFSDRVEHYVRARPGYPETILAFLETTTGLRLVEGTIVVDVGSGTGLSSELFLRGGATVVGVEPNADMRRAAESLLAAYPHFRSIDGRAEETTLVAAGADLIVAGQAFHWFDHGAARREFARITRPPHWVALMWNTRRVTNTPLGEAYEGLVAEFGTDYHRVRHENIDPAELRNFFVAGTYRTARFDNPQTLGLDGFHSRLLSSSYLPGDGHPQRTAMLDAATRLFERHQQDGRVVVEYDTELHVGCVSADAGDSKQ
jgi:SAM-dependent methyltransferase